MATLATLVVKLVGDVSGLSSSLDGASRQVSQFGRDIGAVGKDMTARVTAPIVGTGLAAVVMGNQFNAGMANVISLVPEAAGEIEAMGPAVQALAVQMGQSTGNMTDGLYQVVSAFGLSGDSMDVLEINARAAAAGLATTTDAIDLTSAVTKSYGDTSAEAVQKVADLALKAVQLGQTTFPELAASIGRVTPLASNLGVSQEELFAVMATGTGVTGGAAEVSTQLRGVLQSLMAPTSGMTALMEDLGYANGTAMLEGLGLQGTIAAIVGAAESSGTPLQGYIGSIEGQTLAMALAGPLAGDYADKLGAMGDAAGSTEAAFAAQTEGVNAVGFSMQQAAVKMQVMGQQLGQALMPAVATIMPYIERLISFVMGLVQRFTELDPKTQGIILGVIGLAAALGPVLMILGPIVAGIGALISPIGLVIAAVVALGVAFATDFGGIRTAVQQVWEGYLQPAFETLRAWLAENLPVAIQALANFWTNTLQPALATVWQFLQTSVLPILQQVWMWLATNLPVAIQALARFWETTLLPAIRAVWSFIQTYLVPLFEALVNLHIAAIKLAFEALALVWEQVLRPALTALWEFIQNSVMPAFTRLGEVLEGPVKRAFDAVKGAIQGITDAINTVIGWIDRFREHLSGLTLPDWLTPGSPTPLENGLVGIGRAFNEASRGAAVLDRALAGMRGPELAMAPVGMGDGRNGRNGRGGGGGAWYVTINVNGGASNADTGRAVEQGVLRAARSLGLA